VNMKTHIMTLITSNGIKMQHAQPPKVVTRETE